MSLLEEKKILDLVLCSEENMIENLYVGEPFETSDHQLIRWKLVCSRDKVDTSKQNNNYFKANYDDIRQYIKGRNWDTFSNFTNVEELWAKLKNELTIIREKFVPLMKSVKSKSKWVTKKVLKLRKAKIKSWNKYIKSGKDEKFYDAYKVKLRQSVKENKIAKEKFELRLANNIKADSKSFCVCK